jgi:hypothetical protein
MSIAKPSLSAPWGSGAPSNLADPGGINDTGMPSGGKSIPRRWLNWILNKTDAQTRYLVGRGVPDYDESENYGVNDITQYIGDGKTYRALHANGPATSVKHPSDPSYWERWGHTAAELTPLIAETSDASSLVTIDPGYGVTLGTVKLLAAGSRMIVHVSGNWEHLGFTIDFDNAIGWARSAAVFTVVRGSGQGGAPAFALIQTIQQGLLSVAIGGTGSQGSTWEADLLFEHV